MTAVLATASLSTVGLLVGVLATLVIGLLNHRLQREQQKHQLELVRSAQVTDRFTRAVEQLGSANAQVRMGGIYALERIAKDSEVDRPHVADMLAAFVRDRAYDTGDAGYVVPLKVRAPDVQAALSVLCRDPVCRDHAVDNEIGRLDLSRTDLRRAHLPNAQLQRADLSKARLEGANLRGASLDEAILDGANVSRFEPTNPIYQRGADLSDANLTGAAARGIIGIDEAVTDDAIGLGEALATDRTYPRASPRRRVG